MQYAFSLIIKNGILVDGTGSAGRVADVGICGDKIAYIGNSINQPGCEVIDADGCIVAPGFIDIHSHSDFFWLLSPDSESKIYDGVTTEICGNCGMSAFPLKGQLQENKKKGFKKYGLEVNWQTADDFFTKANEVKSSINRGFLVGHGNIRACVLGYEDRYPERGELVKMEWELREAMESGAFGMSSGLVYPPGCYAKTDELITLCKIVSEYDGIYATHMRDEGDELESALGETIHISRESGVNTQVSHIKTWGEKNWWKIDKIESMLTGARDEGMEITCDRYPYIASATDLDIILPGWVYEGGTVEEQKRLGNPLCRNRIISEMDQRGSDQEFWGTILISSVFNKKNRCYEGQTIAEISNSLNMHPLEFVLDLLYEEDCRVGVIFFNMSEENLARILKWDFVMIGSDSSLRSLKGVLHYGKPHPRCYGTFSRVIRKYVNQISIFSIEEAIYKMTGLPAQKLKLKDRGVIKEGFFADITIFDQGTIAEQATFADPHNYSKGIRHVLVNGELTVINGTHTGIRNGVILKM